MATWEYETIMLNTSGWTGGKVDHDKLKGELNRLGSAGWELVSGFDTNMMNGATRELVLILKRVKAS